MSELVASLKKDLLTPFDRCELHVPRFSDDDLSMRFKQTEAEEQSTGDGDSMGHASVGWEAMLNALLSS